MNNIKLLRVAYNHYFCNMPVISDEDLLNIHYIVTEKLNKDEDIENWEDLHKDLLIWGPFVDAMPSDVIDNIENLMSDIEMNLLPDPEIFAIVSRHKLADSLANEKIIEQHIENVQIIYNDFYKEAIDLINKVENNE